MPQCRRRDLFCVAHRTD